jgi:hypothetical protein
VLSRVRNVDKARAITDVLCDAETRPRAGVSVSERSHHNCAATRGRLGRMDNISRLDRASRVFLAQRQIVYGTEAAT